MKGLVIKNTGFWYTVLTDEGGTVNCKVKGNFRLKGIRTTNPVAVGDRVEVTPQDSDATGEEFSWITAIEDRRNYIIRKSQNLSKQSHILAANVDQAFLVVTINYPETPLQFVDRFLASAEAYNVPVVLIFNKTDLLQPEELQLQKGIVNLYETIGYKCIEISAEKGEGIDQLYPLLEGKVTLLSGNSGVGKSTLINRLIPDANLRTSDISDAHNTGMHTTTFSEMLPLTPLNRSSAALNDLNPLNHLNPLNPSPPSYLIDTPGIKGFGTFDMEPEEITSYFKEIFKFSKDCRFNNCTHTHEPGCAVLQALENHYISQSRYTSYLSMLNDKEDGKYRAAF